MRLALRKSVLFTLLIALVPFLASCDPAWTGEWEVRNTASTGPTTSPTYWSLSTDKLEMIRATDSNDGQECILAVFEVVKQGENTLTALGTTPEVENEKLEFRTELSGETLTITPLDIPKEENVGNEMILTEVGDIPLNTDNCEIQ